MAFYKIEVKKAVLKDLSKVNKHLIRQIFHKIESLREAPRQIQAIKLAGGERSYRLRIGDYRILYQIDDALKLVTVFAVGHRKDIYRKK